MSENIRQRRRPNGLEEKRPEIGPAYQDVGPDPFVPVVESDTVLSVDVDIDNVPQSPMNPVVPGRSALGQFKPGNAGGPGRGHYEVRPSPPSAPDPAGGIDVQGEIEQLKSELRRRLMRLARTKAEPGSFGAIAQLLHSLEQKYIAPAAPVTVEIVSPFPSPGAAASDYSAYQLAAMREENENLKRRLDKLAAALSAQPRQAPVEKPAEPEGWECPTCQKLAGVRRIVPHGQPACSHCGAYADGSQPAPELTNPPVAAVAYVGEQAERGWTGYDDVQHALDAHKAPGGLTGRDSWIDDAAAERGADFDRRWGLR